MVETGGGATPELIARDGALALRRMRDSREDYLLLTGWLNRPHVREWWDPDDPPMTVDTCIAWYRETVDGSTATTSCMVQLHGADIGFVQFYPWSAFADEMTALGLTLPEGGWGVDILIGEESLLNQGIGTRTVSLVCDHLFTEHGALAVGLAVEAINARARRAYEKAGMREVSEFLDTDTRDGVRVRSILMNRDRPAPR